MNAIPEAIQSPDQTKLGLYHKFNVARTDGSSEPGGKHHADEYFVLNLTTDKHALPALVAYAKSCASEYPALAADLRTRINADASKHNLFITVPSVTLPNGTVVPSFEVGQYLSSRSAVDAPQVASNAVPWVNISYHDARKNCTDAGFALITELQCLAIAHDIANQDINWSGGQVGDGKLFQGLHKDTVDSAQPGDYESSDLDERRWHQLSNGARIYDFAGNAYTWVFDDVQGDEKGIVKEAFAKDSPSITTAPYPSMERGMGWRPKAGAGWSGRALVRGGCWRSGDRAGVFYLGDVWPGNVGDYVGFRCTKP